MENKNDIEIYDFISASFYLRNKKVLSPFSKFSLVIVLCLKMHRSCLNGHVLFAGHVTNIGGRKSWRAVRGNGGKKGIVSMNFSRVSEQTQRKMSIRQSTLFNNSFFFKICYLSFYSLYLIVCSISRLYAIVPWNLNSFKIKLKFCPRYLRIMISRSHWALHFRSSLQLLSSIVSD